MTSVMPWERPGSKIDDRHLQRLAVIYVRQSTRQQLVEHQESTRLQYALVDRAVALGWQADRVLVIDDDLGKSGSSAVARTGFQRLVTEIGLDHVGLVLGIEMSRLARSGRDWYQLIGDSCVPCRVRYWRTPTGSTTRPSTTTGCCWGSRAR
ncbi:recombinase family protein [Streptomyces dengpaensis]|uniref:recombinase family protein n=1 Tax=Streptomyces dengpaensis TaxID=2049881 RepID=UPI0019CFED86|nr:recombinase family protein [Streptomyces dengpaensis]